MYQEDADDLKRRGNDAFAAGSHDEAIALYTSAIELDPTNAVLFSNRAAAYTKLEEYQKAKFDADMCIELKPEWAKGYWRKGTAEIEGQEYNAAIKTFERGLEYCPTDQNLVEGKKKAIQRAVILDSVVGDAHGSFDIDGPSKKEPVVQVVETSTEVKAEVTAVNIPNGTEKSSEKLENWPQSLEVEVNRILQSPDHYSILNVPQDATAAQLKRHYHALARMLHPDKCKLPRGEDAMKDVSIAYETLTNEAKRKQYDMYMNARKDDPEKGLETYAEWEARQAGTRLPKFVQNLLRVKGCRFVLVIIGGIIILPILLLSLVIVLIYMLIFVWPKEFILRCCFKDQWEEYKERKEERKRRAREKFDEDLQDELHSHV
mmetsp:Transcript_9085/g.27316  ORF Transcript_9085/g.27316 Transcript_9085/m.27316 type:complete len:375 (+) Transcript_9085:371-1495(+)|eukprot:CAMPEP_0198731130 /NCGR_PEP_ID=MMETSP1475-20131203/28261_1 /TAXON_ID= ORGANISM="Unidentified sp., Strain CCMP1999" /NCGR_SAMPLE_ID=MMETSP1475 /ASSEMBLY_ACC=CAM_ASM_001111 /LENGTH=374 /DNA_ID=CAMNT_0044494049 /DNA_START=336 /DNA_END=1460 /DNA_ORIENTATION=+